MTPDVNWILKAGGASRPLNFSILNRISHMRRALAIVAPDRRLLLNQARKYRERIYWRALPPVLFRTYFENREVEMRRILGSVSGRADIPDAIPFAQQHTFRETFGVSIKVRVIIAVDLVVIELINRQTTILTVE